MEKEIIELVQKCKLVRERNIPNGHDCWGNLDWSTELYVYINNKEHRCFEGWYVIHDGTNVKEVLSEWMLNQRNKDKIREKERQEHLERTGFETPREYAAYLKGKNENK